jgi:hypothetical protein
VADFVPGGRGALALEGVVAASSFTTVLASAMASCVRAMQPASSSVRSWTGRRIGVQLEVTIPGTFLPGNMLRVAYQPLVAANGTVEHQARIWMLVGL